MTVIIARYHSIGSAAQRARVHPRTLRIYEAEGFLVPLRRSNMRRYSERDLAIVAAVRFLTQDKGLNLAGVRLVFDLIGAGRLKGTDVAPQLEGLETALAQPNDTQFASPRDAQGASA